MRKRQRPLEFKIYYADRSTYEGSPEDAPGRGVQAIVQPNGDKPGYHVAQGGDFYLWRANWHGGQWQPADRQGRDFYLVDPGWKKVLFGESIPTPEYEAITKLALDEMKRRNSE